MKYKQTFEGKVWMIFNTRILKGYNSVRKFIMAENFHQANGLPSKYVPKLVICLTLFPSISILKISRGIE